MDKVRPWWPCLTRTCRGYPDSALQGENFPEETIDFIQSRRHYGDLGSLRSYMLLIISVTQCLVNAPIARKKREDPQLNIYKSTMKATARLRLPLLRPSSSAFSQTTHKPSKQPSRPFVSNPLTPLQTLTASRILPYHAPPLYNIIADIVAYPTFIPYCTSSAITSLSAPYPSSSSASTPNDGSEEKHRWPRTADLRIGYGPYDELFRSAVYCLPHTVLEAVAGDAEPTIPRGKLPHYYEDPEQRDNAGDDAERSAGNRAIFTSLLTRWTFKEFPFKPAPPDGKPPQEGSATAPSSPRTEVNLVLEVRFASAVYSALSQAAAPKVAGIMIEAFEKRAAAVLGRGHRQEESRAEEDVSTRSALEGVTRGKSRIM